MKTLRVGIASYKEMKARTTAIAEGKYEPRQDEPKIWFASIESFARVLSERNRLLLRTIAGSGPESLAELAERVGMNTMHVSRTLKALAHLGFVELKRGDRGAVIPRVPYQEISVVLSIRPKRGRARPGWQAEMAGAMEEAAKQIGDIGSVDVVRTVRTHRRGRSAKRRAPSASQLSDS